MNVSFAPEDLSLLLADESLSKAFFVRLEKYISDVFVQAGICQSYQDFYDLMDLANGTTEADVLLRKENESKETLQKHIDIYSDVAHTVANLEQAFSMNDASVVEARLNECSAVLADVVVEAHSEGDESEELWKRTQEQIGFSMKTILSKLLQEPRERDFPRAWHEGYNTPRTPKK